MLSESLYMNDISKETLLSEIQAISDYCPANKLCCILKKRHRDLYEQLCAFTDKICTSENPSAFERLYILKNNIQCKSELLCPVCKKNYKKFSNGEFTSTCSITCHNRSNEVKQKMHATRLANHNGKYADDVILAKRA